MIELPNVVARVRQWLDDYTRQAQEDAAEGELAKLDDVGEFLLTDIKSLLDAVPAPAPVETADD